MDLHQVFENLRTTPHPTNFTKIEKETKEFLYQKFIRNEYLPRMYPDNPPKSLTPSLTSLSTSAHRYTPSTAAPETVPHKVDYEEAEEKLLNKLKMEKKNIEREIAQLRFQQLHLKHAYAPFLAPRKTTVELDKKGQSKRY